MESVTNTHPLFGCFSKLKRANQHLGELRSVTAAWAENVQWHTMKQRDADGLIGYLVKLSEPLPEDMYHAASEAIYQVRSALDQMLVAIATRNGKNSIDHIHFPFMKEECDFDTNVVRKKIDGLPDDVKKLILQTKPWKVGGDLNLWGLNQLANIDKHKQLFPYGAIGGMSILNAEVRGGGKAGAGEIGIILQKGNLLEGVAFSKIAETGYFNFRSAPQLEVQILFQQSVPVFGMKEPVPIIEDLIKLGEGIVEMFSAHCFELQ